MSSRLWALGAAALIVGCGGAKPASTPLAKSKETARVARVAPLTSVSAPPGLFAVARVKNPGGLADIAAAWSGLPIDWRHVLAREAPKFERIFVSGAPLDFAAMLDPASRLEPHVLYAFSFGVSSADAVASFFRDQGGPVADLGGGTYRARVGDDLVCLAGPALGAAQARVVCSDEAESVDALAPYMSRGLATETLGTSEIHAFVTVEPFRRRYGSQVALVKTMGVPFALRELSLDDEKFDRALRDVLYGLADEVTALTHDLDRVELDVSLAPSGNDAIVAFSVSFAGQESFSSKAVARAAARAEPPANIFWKLPADATAAGFMGRSDPDTMRPIAASLRALADGWLEHQKLAESRRAPLLDALERVLVASPHAAYATVPAGLAPAPPIRHVSAFANFVRRAATGEIVVVDEGGDRVVALSSALVKALSDKTFREQLVKNHVFEAGELPVLRERPLGGKGAPKGAMVFELELPPPATSSSAGTKPTLRNADPASRARGKKQRSAEALSPPRGKNPEVAAEPFCAVLVVVPDGPLYWFAVGTDERALLARIAAAQTGSGSTMSSRRELAALRTDPVLSGGFSSLEAILGPVLEHLGRGPNPLLQLPHRGQVPLLWRGVADAQGPRFRFEGHVPRALIEDVVALAASTAP